MELVAAVAIESHCRHLAQQDPLPVAFDELAQADLAKSFLPFATIAPVP
jgi:hypothetical protein